MRYSVKWGTYEHRSGPHSAVPCNLTTACINLLHGSRPVTFGKTSLFANAFYCTKTCDDIPNDGGASVDRATERNDSVRIVPEDWFTRNHVGMRTIGLNIVPRGWSSIRPRFVILWQPAIVVDRLMFVVKSIYTDDDDNTLPFSKKKNIKKVTLSFSISTNRTESTDCINSMLVLQQQELSAWKCYFQGLLIRLPKTDRSKFGTTYSVNKATWPVKFGDSRIMSDTVSGKDNLFSLFLVSAVPAPPLDNPNVIY